MQMPNAPGNPQLTIQQILQLFTFNLLIGGGIFQKEIPFISKNIDHFLSFFPSSGKIEKITQNCTFNISIPIFSSEFPT